MKLKPVLLYFFFFMAAFVVFLFLLFPQKKTARYLSHSLKNSLVHVSIEKVKPGLPFKFYFKNTKIWIEETMEIVPESFEVSLGPASLFAAEKTIQFKSDIYQGFVNGSLHINTMEPPSISYAKLTMSGVKIKNLRYRTDIADILMGGELSGEYKQGEARHPSSGSILIRNFTAEMKNSFFNTLNLPLVDFTDIKLEFIQDLNKVSVTKCLARGSIIHVKLKGTIDILVPFQKTKVNFTGMLLPDSPYLAKFANTASIRASVKNILKDGIQFNIKGTVENPKIGI